MATDRLDCTSLRGGTPAPLDTGKGSSRHEQSLLTFVQLFRALLATFCNSKKENKQIKITNEQNQFATQKKLGFSREEKKHI
eukprot:5547443-Amphidinium_carterae.2